MRWILLLAMLCTPQLVSAYSPKLIGGWEVSSPADGVGIAATKNASNEFTMFSYGCSKKQIGCNFILQANLNCKNGESLQVMVNADNGTFVTYGSCVFLGDRTELIINANDSAAIRLGIANSRVTSFAIPLVSSLFKVVRFNTNGAGESFLAAESIAGVSNPQYQ